MALSAFAVWGGVLLAQAMPVPLELQAAILNKVLSYDQTLEQRGGERLIVIVHAGDAAAVAPLTQAFVGVGAKVKVVGATDFAAAAPGAAAVYLWPGAPAAELAKTAKAAGVLTMSGLPALVEKGTVAVGLELNDKRRPQIILHLPRLKAEGHTLAAAVLSLARRIE